MPTTWPAPPPSLGAIQLEEVDIWQASLDWPAAILQKLKRILSPDEQERAERYRFPQDRDRFIAGRGILRVILSRYLNVAPPSLSFDCGPQGKPALGGEPGQLRLQFNVAHSGGIALYAFSGGKSVGIDIESIRTDFACEEIAARYFAPAERKRLTQCPTSLKQRSFFACWTRKEAAIKAVGAGLSIPLDSFEVPVLPEAFPQPLVLKWLSETPPHWWLESLNVAPDFAAAVVVEGDRPQFRYWTFPAAYLDPLT